VLNSNKMRETFVLIVLIFGNWSIDFCISLTQAPKYVLLFCFKQAYLSQRQLCERTNILKFIRVNKDWKEGSIFSITYSIDYSIGKHFHEKEKKEALNSNISQQNVHN